MGYAPLRYHLPKLNLSDDDCNDICRIFQKEKETAHIILCEFEAVASERIRQVWKA
jgi:hypothetical protein